MEQQKEHRLLLNEEPRDLESMCTSRKHDSRHEHCLSRELTGH